MFSRGKRVRWGSAARTPTGESAERDTLGGSPAVSPRGLAAVLTGPLTRGGGTEVRRRQCRLDGDPEAVRTARVLVTQALRAWGRADLLDDAALVVSELVTNAVVHGSPPVTIAVAYEGDLVIEVADACRDLPVRRLPGSGGHFGVWLADELCNLHVRVGPVGKTIIAVFPIS